MKRWIAFALVALLALPATALGEGTVQEAPDIDLNLPIESASPASYLPDASVYAGYAGWQPDWADSASYVPPTEGGDGLFKPEVQTPGLTPGEQARAEALLAAYQQGEKTGDGAQVLSAVTDVVVGVYALNPEDFDGEGVYTLLPAVCLTDEQLLNVIDAFHQLGQTFDPAGLNYRNCARGGGIEASRFLTAAERERCAIIARQIERGVLTSDLIDPGDVAAEQMIRLDPRYYAGMDVFALHPYRLLTDKELAAGLFRQGATASGVDLSALERRAVAAWTVWNAPLAMTFDSPSAGAYLPVAFDETGETRFADPGRDMTCVSASVQAEDGATVHYQLFLDTQTQEITENAWHYSYGASPLAAALSTGGTASEGFFVNHARALTAAQYAEAADAYARALMPDATLSWHDRGECALNSWNCVVLRALLPTGKLMTVYLDPADARVMGVKILTDTVSLFHLEDHLDSVPTADNG